ncbi:hypothetical protein NP233_g4429 [Leucocoprinus birnbaumii]|uniref:Nephrocystin 3-like N-terminal domain-containing protein n=1 Tax=Leucocoprinus birnbaumii TaxID=56174 RepID=A0AAD5VYE3_9AGAR|nr:hypothetical protein NP233_g4429 [Leucocoprinus birnbaumii]
MFRNPHNFSISGGVFESQQSTFQLHGNNQINVGLSDHRGIITLLEASTPEAALDSVGRNYAPRCFPGTREQYIEDITNWAASSHINRPPIYWMKGPAGVGKSSIAQTSALRIQEARYLGAAFFFSVNGRQKDYTRFFPSLAYQLSTVLHEYRSKVNERVLIDPSIFKKTMKAQFEFLIVDPLRELRELGKEVPRKSVFIDGLDECESKDAQAEIIEIISSSVQAQSTPFQWAIFSREEPRISSTFALPQISLHCHVVFLPISRDIDKEIGVYLRGEFENIVRRRLGNMTLSSPWPTDEDIKKLVDGAAGLFAYAATILRFIDSDSDSDFKKALCTVLDTIVNPSPHSLPVFYNLDRMYTLVLQGIPTSIAASTDLILYVMSSPGEVIAPLTAAALSNRFGISEVTFKSICSYLHAVLAYHDPPAQLSEMFAQDPNLGHSYLEQDPSSKLNVAPDDQLFQVHGTVSFLHKSFYDFLRNSERSGSTFNRGRISLQRQLHDYHQHLHLASNYVVKGSRLEPASDAGTVDPSLLLPWPTGSYFNGHYDMLAVSLHRITGLLLPMEAIEEFDFRKALAALGTLRKGEWEYDSYESEFHSQCGEGVVFQLYSSNTYDDALFQLTLEAEKLKLVTPYHPHHNPYASTSAQSSSSQSNQIRYHGLHTVGFGEKSVIWYWEYDKENHLCYEFQTLDYTKTMRIFQSEKHKMWNKLWVPPPWLLEDNPVETNVPVSTSPSSSNIRLDHLPILSFPSTLADAVASHSQTSEARDGLTTPVAEQVVALSATHSNIPEASVHTALVLRSPGMNQTSNASVRVDAHGSK